MVIFRLQRVSTSATAASGGVRKPGKRVSIGKTERKNSRQDLGIATVAEGIECSDEAETCQRLGINFAQGFFYGRPLPITEIN
jgi:predicted signal transduction protein with EAL and GGDEF domain